MARPERFFEWQALVERDVPPSAGSRERLRILWGLFLLVCVAIFGRAVQLEATQGAAFRAAAAQPGRQRQLLPAARGRILARDGTVLAQDEPIESLAVHYRYLQDPPDAAWLRRTARSRLPKADCNKAAPIAAAMQAVCAERDALHRQLAERCGVSPDVWQRRVARIERRVEGIAERVNRVRQDRLAQEEALARIETDGAATTSAGPPDLLLAAADLFGDDEARAEPRVIVAEEVAYHVMVPAAPADVVAAIRAEPARYPGIRIIEGTRRSYPAGTLAANIVGHVGQHNRLRSDDDEDTLPASSASTGGGPVTATKPASPIGRLGIELACESTLRGQPGVQIDLTNQRGQRMSLDSYQPPTPGRDVTLSLDPAVQQAAETLLDRALARKPDRGHDESAGESTHDPPPAGGAIVVMNVATGELLAAASAPRFDPNLFTRGDDDALAELLTAAGHPLFDRVAKMALPPGSVFKIITAVALLESKTIEPETPFACQGYLHDPDHLRCAVYRHHGVGHGEVRVGDALAQSCNVFFFHHAGEMGPGPLVAWAERFGAGRRTGVDLPDEAAGRLGTPGSLPRVSGRAWQPGDTHGMSVGQGVLSATPLQVARWLAAIANGGTLVTPRVTIEESIAQRSSERLPISATTLAAIRSGLARVVNDPSGTGYATVRLAWPTIAGKTGTAEVGGGQAEHAWFAGYAPADDPKWVIVVVLEHGGNGATAAGPLARGMLQALHSAGYFAD